MTPWQARASGIIKAEMARRHLGYRELAERFQARGSSETEKNLSNKVSRGAFTAAFFLECLDVLGVGLLRLDQED